MWAEWKNGIIAGCVAAFAILICGGVILAYRAGYSSAESDQATGQLEHNKDTQRGRDEIDRKTPFDSERSVAIDWLLAHTRKQ